MNKINVLEGVPYREEGMGRRKLADEDHLLLLQAALRPGQSVPAHISDSNVHILVLVGELLLDLSGAVTAAGEGDLVPVEPGTAMNITNRSEGDATFLIIKTPHPREWKKKKEE